MYITIQWHLYTLYGTGHRGHVSHIHFQIFDETSRVRVHPRVKEKQRFAHFAPALQKCVCFRSRMRFLVRSARQRGEWCSGSSKKEKVKLREKLRLVTGCSGGRRGGRRWGNPLRLACDPSPSPPAETDRGGVGSRCQLLTTLAVFHN